MLFFLPCAAVRVDPVELRHTVDIICEAAGLESIEKLAYALEMDEAQLHRQLQGEGHFSLTRVVAKLGGEVVFWQRLAELLARKYGLTQETHRSAGLFWSVLGRPQLKMAADVPQKRMA